MLPNSPFAGIPTAPFCASHCLSSLTCLAFSYNQINGSCALFRSGLSELGVQKRGDAGAVFWWDRTCFERRGDVVGMWDEREEESFAADRIHVDVDTEEEEEEEEGRDGAAQASAHARPDHATTTILASRIAPGRAVSVQNRIMHDPLALAKVDAAIDDAIADIIATPTPAPATHSVLHSQDSAFQHADKNENEAATPLASLLRSSLLSAPTPSPKVWPYGVGALPADDDDAKRAWTWEGQGQAQGSFGKRARIRARRSV